MHSLETLEKLNSEATKRAGAEQSADAEQSAKPADAEQTDVKSEVPRQ